MPRLLAALDGYTEWCGRSLSWLTALMVVLTVAVVVARYGFSIGALALQETITYLHASVFLLGAGYTLKHGAHVRVDILYRRFSMRTRCWIDALGCLVFLLPMCLFIAATGLEFAWASWRVREHSIDSAGLPFVYVLKALLPLMALQLGLQGLAELGRCIAVLTRVEDRAP